MTDNDALWRRSHASRKCTPTCAGGGICARGREIFPRRQVCRMETWAHTTFPADPSPVPSPFARAHLRQPLIADCVGPLVREAPGRRRLVAGEEMPVRAEPGFSLYSASASMQVERHRQAESG